MGTLKCAYNLFFSKNKKKISLFFICKLSFLQLLKFAVAHNVMFCLFFQTAVTRGVRACVSLFHLQSILVSNVTRLLCGNNNSGLNGDAYSDNTAADSDLLALPGKYLF